MSTRRHERQKERRIMAEMNIYFPGNKKVYADYNGFTIETDQPVRGGGDGTAPAPFDLFLASIGTCAGVYALGFMQQRGIDPAGAKLTMRMGYNAQVGLIDKVDLELTTPPGFPEKYKDAIINAMELCAVKKHLAQPPAFSVTTVAS
jgi:putative redox protein